MTKFLLYLFFLFPSMYSYGQSKQENIIDSLINQWHKAAATGDETVFFNLMDSSAIYIGTDASERWTKDEFYRFAMPYFSKGKGWNFKPIERQLFISPDSSVTWFNETLNTWMGVCRSSGILLKKSDTWKLEQYHLSVTVPNKKMKTFIRKCNTPVKQRVR